MSWTKAIDNSLLHTGTTADAYMMPTKIGPGWAIEIGSVSVAYRVGAIVYASSDGRNGWMVGVFGDTGADPLKLSIRRINNGVIEAPQTGGDAPNDATPVTHSLTSGQFYTLRVELIDNRIVASLRGSLVFSTVALAYLNDVAPTFLQNDSWGVWSTTNNARAVDLARQQATFSTSDEREVLVVGFENGDVHACYDGVNLERLATAKVPTNIPLTFAEYGGRGFIGGGGKLFVVDVQARSVDPFVATAGELPGTTDGSLFDVIGVSRSGARMVYVMRPGVIYSAVGDPFDVDTGAIEDGRAFDLAATRFGQSVGQDIVSVFQSTDDAFIIATTNSVFAVIGDPISGNFRQLPITFDSGPVSWSSAITVDATGRAYIHTPDGGIVFGTISSGVNITRGTLREGIQISRAERSLHTVSVVRDTTRGYLFVFNTRRIGSVATGQHHVYDESQGDYQAGAGGWFPIGFANASHHPTAACVWQGRCVIGTMGGDILEFDDAAADDVGTPINALCQLQLVDENGVVDGVMVHWVRPEFSPQADGTQGGLVSLRVFTADSPSKMFTPGGRQQAWAGDFTDTAELGQVRQRGNVVSLELLSTVASASQRKRWWIEQVEVDISPAPVTLRRTVTDRVLPAPTRGGLHAPAATAVEPPDVFVECGADVNGPVDVVPTGFISVVLGAVGGVGQNATPTVTVENATGPFTYDWSVIGLAGAWASGDNAATPPAVLLAAGNWTIQVVITGGTLRAPLIVTIGVTTRSTTVDTTPGDRDGGVVSGGGASTEEETEATSKALNPFVAESPPPGSCAISAGTPPAFPSGYGGGAYSGGGWV
jgi:hypothetical protein